MPGEATPSEECALCKGTREYFTCLIGLACTPDTCVQPCGCMALGRPWTAWEVDNGYAH